ncbi:MAG: ABC transporter ATP-binding protein, partial [Clostridia bacterium]|nr:ABC transporter ATP-binding protein [Clostridia bacterium]
MKEKKKSDLAVLLGYAGSYKGLTFLGLGLSAVAMILGMLPYICIWLAARDLIAAAPDWTSAAGIARYGWMAFGFAVAGIAVYFAALMCTHLAAFRTASNIRKAGMAHLMKTPLGFFDSNASGLLRNRLDGAASETETLLAHNLADIVGTAAMFIAMLVLMFVFDWRMGAACLLAAAVSVISMATMMGGKNAGLIQEYQAAQDVMSKSATEYVRGIPVVKVFQQTVFSFRAFKEAIEDYSTKAERYTDGVCRVPQSVNLTFTEGAFIFLVPAALLLAPGAVYSGNFAAFVTNFAFYAVFSAIISTALARIMFAASGMMLAGTALRRINEVMSAPELKISDDPQVPKDNSVEFRDVSFTYDGAETPALDRVSFKVSPGQTVALVGPSGGGKTTAASLIPRFWDVSSGSVLVGGVDVRDADPHVLMDSVAFVFQNNRLFKASILENVRAARPNATKGEVMAALSAAQCDDIIEKLPDGMDTVIGTEGTYLSGGEQQRVALARAILK